MEAQEKTDKLRGKGLRRSQPLAHLSLRFVACRMVLKLVSVIEATQFVVLCDGSPTNLIQVESG